MRRFAIGWAPALAVAVMLLFPAMASSQSLADLRAVEEPGERRALDAATRDLCGKQIVLLGENGSHGDGRTPAFKATLIQRLVERCGFNAVFFESSHYDFLAIMQAASAGQAVTPDMVSSAIGGMWNQSEELATLVPFLASAAATGRVALGGIDDQLGSRGALYELEQLPTDLASHLPSQRREECHAILRRRIWSSYPAAAPYTETTRSQVRLCLSEVEAAVRAAEPTSSRERDDTLQMIANFERWIARDFITDNRRIWARDHSMYLNLRWLADRLPPRSKIIVWAANEHVAKDASAMAAFAGGRNLGSYVHEAYGGRAFALGFSAAGGSFRYGREAREISAAPADSLEALALVGVDGDTGYVEARRLRRFGVISGGGLNSHQQMRTRWSDVYDGVVIFRTERPPKRIDE